MREDDIVVSMETNIPTLRAMLKAVEKAHATWAGGDPAEQEKLISMKSELYAVLMSALMEHGLV